MDELRTKDFKKNDSLESFLTEINENLSYSESRLLGSNSHKNDYPIIFVMGALRSGTTLMTQWLASTGEFAYPTNFMSRFYQNPIIASKMQLLLTDEKYNFRNEIRDFNSKIDFVSKNGKTIGALSPNEYWYFWRHFLPLKNCDYIPTSELLKRADINTFKAAFKGITNVFNKPFALKGMILNYNIDFLNKVFDKVIFIHIKRDSLANIESALEARKNQLGSIHKWYSFKIPEYNELRDLNPYEQVAGQVHYINKAIEKGFEKVQENKKLSVNYEDFCKNPKEFYDNLAIKIKLQGFEINQKYKSNITFKNSRDNVKNSSIIYAYNKFSKK